MRFVQLAGMLLFLVANWVFSGERDFARHNEFLFRAFDRHQTITKPLCTLRYQDVVQRIKAIHKKYPMRLQIESVGKSVLGRKLWVMKFGRGEKHIFLWSQIHGNEPTGTAVLLDVFDLLVREKKQPFVTEIWNGATIWAIPMLNPDGAEKREQRNAQGLDIDLDAFDLQTSEGRVLKAVYERFRPCFVFDLCDGDQRHTGENTGQLATLTLKVPAFDSKEDSLQLQAKKVAAIICDVLKRYLDTHIARGHQGSIRRTFADAMQNWGTSAIVIESGSWKGDRDTFIRRMNFIGLLTVLYSIATGEYQTANPEVYDTLPKSGYRSFDLLIQHANIIDGTGIAPFLADIGINFEEISDTFGQWHSVGKIADMGDLTKLAAKDTIDAAYGILTPGFIAVVPQLTVASVLDTSQIGTFLREGFTTLIGSCLLKGIVTLRQDLQEVWWNGILPNFGLLAEVPDESDQEIFDLTLQALLQGAVALQDSSLNPQLYTMTQWFKRLYLSSSVGLDAKWNGDFSTHNVRSMTWKRARKLGLLHRGKVKLGFNADLLIFQRLVSEQHWYEEYDLRYVLVNGHKVVVNGKILPGDYGMVLFPSELFGEEHPY